MKEIIVFEETAHGRCSDCKMYAALRGYGGKRYCMCGKVYNAAICPLLGRRCRVKVTGEYTDKDKFKIYEVLDVKIIDGQEQLNNFTS